MHHAPPLRVTLRPPCPALAPFVDALWCCEGEPAHARERILPTGTMQIVVSLHEDELRSYHGEQGLVRRTDGAVLVGSFARSYGIDTVVQRRAAGVHFKPGGALPFFAEPADDLRESHVGLGELWGRPGATLRERLLGADTSAAILAMLEAELLQRAVRPLARDRFVDRALRALEAGRSVRQVAHELGTTAGSLLRRFRRSVGLTPKRFARARRFQRALGMLGTGAGGAAVAVACGYADQAHLVHEAQALAGLSPTALRRSGATGRNHVPLVE